MRIIVSWAAVVIAVALSIIVVPGVFGAPQVTLPLLLAYVFRYEMRPPIPRSKEAHRGWLLLPVVLVALHVILFPSPLLLWAAIAAFLLWCAWDDILIYRHDRETRDSQGDAGGTRLA
jgi:hypothetical protein